MFGDLGTELPAFVPPHRAWQTTEQPKVQVEIQTATDAGPRFTLTNLSAKTLTACYIEISSSLEKRAPFGEAWDALAQGIQPLAPGESTSMPLGHVVGGPIPDKVKISAGVWDNGETFGRAERVGVLLTNRRFRESEYEEAISILREGVERGWSRNQFLVALSGKKATGPIYAMQRTLEANKNLDQKPRYVQTVAQRLLESFTQRREILRQAKPHGNVPASP